MATVTLIPVPAINQTRDHRAALRAWLVFFPCNSSPINAPINGHIIIQTHGITKNHIIVQTIAPVVPRDEPQYFLVHQAGIR
jgi:hypothetical protein